MKTIGQYIPPTLRKSWRTIFGPTHSTGYNHFISGYPYSIALVSGKRQPWRYLRRRGLSGSYITSQQSLSRSAMINALSVFANQPYYLPITPSFGPRPRTWWYEQATLNGQFYTSFFFAHQLPYSHAKTISPWDPTGNINIFAGHPGDNSGFVYSPPLDAGTYTVTLKPSSWSSFFAGTQLFIIAVTVYKHTGITPLYQGKLGQYLNDPSANYAPIIDWALSPSAAWSNFTNSAFHTSINIPLDNGNQIAIQFLNEKIGTPFPHNGHLEVTITKQ